MKPLVVYIDDEPRVCRVFEIHLEMRQIEVRTFTDPREAVEFINTHEVRAVFSDYRMPLMTGADVLASIEREVPFYIVTGGVQSHSDPLIAERGITILPKPVDYDEIARLIEGLSF